MFGQSASPGANPGSLGAIFASQFAARLAAADTATVSINAGGVVPAYSAATTIQPGSWISIYGSNLAAALTTWNNDFPTTLGGTQVSINNKPAYLLFVSPNQINAQAPDDTATGSVQVVVDNAGTQATSTVTLGAVGPSFLRFGDATHVAGIITRTDNSGKQGGGSFDFLGAPGNTFGGVPAKAGDVVSLFGVGFGPTNPPVPAGKAFQGAAPVTTQFPVTIGGTTVTPSFEGINQAGVYQLNITIPPGLGTGDQPLGAIVSGVSTDTGATGAVIPLQ
jgi:uncharacterized protein (TIGR03437 family)